MFESDTLRVFPRLKFPQGDIDLLLIDLTDMFGLVCQLKWTTSADKPAGVESDDRQFARGVEQAERSLASGGTKIADNWLNELTWKKRS